MVISRQITPLDGSLAEDGAWLSRRAVSSILGICPHGRFSRHPYAPLFLLPRLNDCPVVQEINVQRDAICACSRCEAQQGRLWQWLRYGISGIDHSAFSLRAMRSARSSANASASNVLGWASTADCSSATISAFRLLPFFLARSAINSRSASGMRKGYGGCCVGATMTASIWLFLILRKESY